METPPDTSQQSQPRRPPIVASYKKLCTITVPFFDFGKFSPMHSRCKYCLYCGLVNYMSRR